MKRMDDAIAAGGEEAAYDHVALTMIIGTMTRSVSTLLVLALCVAQTPADRGVRLADHPGNTVIKHGRMLVCAIGIDNYQNWPKLRNAVSDATGVVGLLHGSGFTDIEPALKDEKATKTAILKLIEDNLPSELKEDDELVLFFAGHGISRDMKVGNRTYPVGYIVPVEASAHEKEKWSEYIPLGYLLEKVGVLPARHILLILDSCGSGVALDETYVGRFGSGAGVSPYFRISRRIMTSAGAKQTASDSGPVPGHSLFTGMLIQGMQTGEAPYREGEISDFALADFVQKQVSKASRSQQIPEYGQFLADERGEMVLPKPDPQYLTSRTPPPLTEGAELNRGGSNKRTSRLAIVIGSNRYENLPSLRFAVADARGVGEALETLGYSVKYAIDLRQDQLILALYDIANGASSNLGSLAVFYAGHWIQRDGRNYLALVDSDPGRPEKTSLDFSVLQSILVRTGAQQKMFFIDTTPPEFLGPREFHEVRPMPPSLLDKGFHVMFSAAPQQVISDSPANLHGLFASYLIRGLGGKAAGPDGVITIDSLEKYVGDSVSYSSKGRQIPVSFGTSTGSFAIGVVDSWPGGVAKDFMVRALERIKTGGGAEVEDGLQLLRHATAVEPSIGDAWYYRSLFERRLGREAIANYDLSKAKMFGSEALEEGANPFVLATSARTGDTTLHPVREKWALVVGIGRFQDRRIPRLKYTSKDAQDFAALLRDKTVGHFPDDHVHLVIDEEATTKRIKGELNWLARSAAPDDLVVIYLSTHGSPRELDSVAGVNYIITADTELRPEDHLYATALPMVDLSDVVRTRIRARRTAIFLDTCRSGDAVGPASVVTASVSGDALDRIRAGDGRAIITSSQVTEKSWESDALGHGYFTYYLMQALRQEKGLASIDKIYAFVKENVSKKVRSEINAPQNPLLSRSDTASDIVIGTVPERK